jgi:Flp pilus assembly pilin Flp
MWARRGDDRGAIMAEYSLLLALVALVMVGAVIALRDHVEPLFTSVSF